jgi:hypothetical protein
MVEVLHENMQGDSWSCDQTLGGCWGNNLEQKM